MLVAMFSNSPYVAGFIPVLGAAIGWGGQRAFRYWRKGMATVINDAEDAAKDDLIRTLEQNHKALVDRVKILEDGLAEARTRGDRLERALDEKTIEFETLKQYAAPDGFKMLEAAVTQSVSLQRDILQRLTEVEERQAAGVESLAEAITLLSGLADKMGA